tara:strand:- start:1182 stop:1400 length:219 start_codon:yes stop_codon:yes gene_type:complete
MNDKELMAMAHFICDLPEYRRKELAILILSSLLNSLAVEQLAGFMVGLADKREEELSKQAEAHSRMEDENDA